MPTPIPLRDLSEFDQRGLIGNVVTVKVYETVESTDPAATLHGRLAVIAVTPDATVLMFEHQVGTPSAVDAASPVTVEW